MGTRNRTKRDMKDRGKGERGGERGKVQNINAKKETPSLIRAAVEASDTVHVCLQAVTFVPGTWRQIGIRVSEAGDSARLCLFLEPFLWASLLLIVCR